MSMVTLKVEGMTCGHCVMAVTKALKAIQGVEDAAVSLQDKSAVVKYDPARATLDAMKEAVSEEGYEVVGVN